jgi:hypothetical protein
VDAARVGKLPRLGPVIRFPSQRHALIVGG